MSTQQHNQHQQELSHFNQLAEHWWDQNGALKTLHDINPTRLAFMQQHQPLQGLKILDIGCGAGILSEAMAKAGAEVVGIDLAKSLIQVAQAHAEQQQVSGLTYQCISAEAMAAQHAHSFDVVVCMELLEHVPDPQAIIQAAAQCLKPQGWLFASTINRGIKAQALTIWVAEYLLNLIPKGTHHAEQFIAPHQLIQWADDAGLTAVELMGLHYHPFKRRAWLSMPADVNYLMALRKSS